MSQKSRATKLDVLADTATTDAVDSESTDVPTTESVRPSHSSRSDSTTRRDDDEYSYAADQSPETRPVQTTSTESDDDPAERRLKKNFRCKTCRKRFPTASHLNRHLVSHSIHKEFACPFSLSLEEATARYDKLGCEVYWIEHVGWSVKCTKAFGRRDNMLQHYRGHLKKIVPVVDASVKRKAKSPIKPVIVKQLIPMVEPVHFEPPQPYIESEYVEHEYAETDMSQGLYQGVPTYQYPYPIPQPNGTLPAHTLATMTHAMPTYTAPINPIVASHPMHSSQHSMPQYHAQVPYTAMTQPLQPMHSMAHVPAPGMLPRVTTPAMPHGMSQLISATAAHLVPLSGPDSHRYLIPLPFQPCHDTWSGY